MSDMKMSKPQELCELFADRGVEHTIAGYGGGYVKWQANGAEFMAFEHDGALSVCQLGSVTLSPEETVAATLGPKVTGNTSDGYHTFNELYHHRAVLFSIIVRDHRELAWKSMRHHDGTMYDGMFIVGIETPEGQATYHYDIDPYWDMFDCKELDQAPEWDGHTPSEAIERIATLSSCNCSNNCTNSERTRTCHDKGYVYYDERYFRCSNCGCEFDYSDFACEFAEGRSLGSPHYCPNCGARVVGVRV